MFSRDFPVMEKIEKILKHCVALQGQEMIFSTILKAVTQVINILVANKLR